MRSRCPGVTLDRARRIIDPRPINRTSGFLYEVTKPLDTRIVSVSRCRPRLGTPSRKLSTKQFQQGIQVRVLLRKLSIFSCAEIATLMEAAGLEARLQFGEVLWWFFPNVSGMAFYDAYTTEAFQTTHGRSLHLFLTPNDDHR
jgi:hypothetical protein